MGDFSDGRDRGFATASRNALFDGYSRLNAGDLVQVGAGKLFYELASVRRHGFHEAALSLAEDDVESECALTRTRDSRDNGQLVVRNGYINVLQIMLPSTGYC